VNAEQIEIRPLRTMAECHEAAALQREVWGGDYTDVVPATLLHVVDYVGGLAAGAFDASGELLGFVFGVSGIRDGNLVHWSHMLGVRASARNLGLGRRLKEYQRDTLRAIGVKRILWTFDPLMAKNAYFNLTRLGARVVEYVPDMYGTSTSALHLGMPTDRLIVCLETAARLPEPGSIPIEPAPILTAFPRRNDVTVARGERPPERALIEIPAEVLDVLAQSPSSAQTWRLAVRDYFEWALARGYSVAGMHRDTAADRSFYVMERAQAAVAAPTATRELQKTS